MEEPTSHRGCCDGIEDGTLLEMFACGTAAVIAPIGMVDRRLSHPCSRWELGIRVG
ncbi:MAG: hypothetical protein IPI82_15630 [Candidatus Microthrix sp.]|nr:hypothetical protein [Candidatus Microthrix sp.]MBK7323823.1 hypothetical protein [Candidatus Microthrix sp.]